MKDILLKLGVNYSKEKTIFNIFSPESKEYSVRIFGSYDSLEPEKTVEMTRNEEYICATILGDLEGKYYTFLIDGIETIDPYAKLVGVNGNRGYIYDLNKTNPSGFEDDRFIPSRTPIIYEMHIRDFSSDITLRMPANNHKKFNGVDNNIKTFNDFSAGIDYLCELGVTHVHILPMYDFCTVDEKIGEPYNWGYDPMNYNCVEGSYSSNPFDPICRVNELKKMIMRLHQNGIGVIMDVVYNHTYNTNSPLQNTAKNYYYRMKDGKFCDGSGCGNETRSEAPMYRKFMIDSVCYWAKEYHIDGFRFDLMGLHDVDTMNQIREALDNLYSDGRGRNILMYGEPWCCNKTIDTYTPADIEHVNLLNDRIAIFSPVYRDSMRGRHFGGLTKGYASGNLKEFSKIKEALAGHKNKKNLKINSFRQQILYCSCHDDHTLFDHIGLTTDNWSDIVISCKMCATTTLSGLGISFFQAGEEFLRTKNLIQNTYNRSDYLNRLDWLRREEYDEVVKFYAGLIKLRKENKEFSLDNTKPRFKFLENKEKVLAYQVGEIIYIINNSGKEYELNLNGIQGKVYELATSNGFKEIPIEINKLVVNNKDIWIGKIEK